MQAVLDHLEKTLSEIAQNIYEQTGSEHALSSILLFFKTTILAEKGFVKYFLSVLRFDFSLLM